MGPYGAGKEEVEPLSECGEVEIRVVTESGRLDGEEPGFEEKANPGVEHLSVWLDSEVAALVQEVDQPIAYAKAAASYVEDFGVWTKALV